MTGRPPLARNIRWFQLAYGAFTAVLAYRLVQHYRGVTPLAMGEVVLSFMGIVVAFFVFLIYLNNLYRFGLVPDYSKKCRFCNGPVNRYSEFCEHCGADLIAPEHLVPCGKCGIEVYEGTKHCPECGALIAKKEKGKKGHKKRREEEAAREARQEGWDTPIDATTGVPPPREPDR